MHDAETKAETTSSALDASSPPTFSRFQEKQQLYTIKGKGPSIPGQPSGSRYSEWRCLERTDSPAWDRVISDLSNEIKTRHYFRRTFTTYADWARKFPSFLRDKRPEELSEGDVKEYLTYLAVCIM